MLIRIAAAVHSRLLSGELSPRDQRGQGTVEYVGTVVMVTLLVAAIGLAAKGWAPAIGEELKGALKKAITELTSPFAAK